MAESLRETLRARMAKDERVTLYGQDIEDPKGDVFGVTRGLSTAFPGRVRNAPLSESTIVGASIGRALAGGRPVAFLQFADFIPLALNQLATELASMDWRTQGGWKAPVIVLASCGAYRPGLGPFHAHTFDTMLAHLPGLDVAVASTGEEAAGMLNAAFESERPTVLLYPKALLHSRAHLAPNDVVTQFVPLGASRVTRAGSDITLVGWGNTVSLCERAAVALEGAGVAAEVIDLRWLAPWDRETVVRSVAKTRKLLVVHEDNLSAGFGAEVIASVVESIDSDFLCRRIARPDAFVPCHFGAQLESLPSYRRTLEMAAGMTGLDLRWEAEPVSQEGRQVVKVLGSSPADQTVELVELLVREGMSIKAGQAIACLEADKAVFELCSPSDGVVETIHLRVGDRASVDAPLLTLVGERMRRRQPSREPDEVAHLTPRAGLRRRSSQSTGAKHVIVIQGMGTARGSARLDNRELAAFLPMLASKDGGSDGIFERTGIESRTVAGETQDAVSMAVDAARKAMEDASIGVDRLALIVCSTSTPTMISPSTACQVLGRLAPDADVPAYDILAACSGYLYALAQAWDFLQQNPERHVLVLTTEVMRGIVDIRDPQTSPIFADAATATVLGCQRSGSPALAIVERPVLGARGEDGTALRVPLPGAGETVHMDGRRVFTEAVRSMGASLVHACNASGLNLADLDLVVPHQANGRMIEAMRMRLKLSPCQVWNGIRHEGNSSSSSIPLALDTVLRQVSGAERIGICAFGAGFTSGAALLSRNGLGRSDPRALES